MNKIILGIVGIAAVVLVVVLIVRSQGVVPETQTGSLVNSAPGAMMGGKHMDQMFIIQMIPHHEGAIDMARIAKERSKRPEILKLADAIISAQEKEIDMMREWYQLWFGGKVPENAMERHGMGHMDSMSGDSDKLATVSESEFDREFITQMIPHHEMAVMMAQMLEGGTDRPEMKKLADDIITSQSSEITQMRQWLDAWY